ncbi:MAG: RNA-binding protein [Acidobacteria bacterium]|nr:RNA-binding protein [Acidobacteriota bacterium]
MPRGPKGEWRPADPVACAVHVAKIGAGLIEETYEPPVEHRRPTPPDPKTGGRARAAKMTAEQRSAVAKRASDARWKKGATA